MGYGPYDNVALYINLIFAQIFGYSCEYRGIPPAPPLPLPFIRKRHRALLSDLAFTRATRPLPSKVEPLPAARPPTRPISSMAAAAWGRLQVFRISAPPGRGGGEEVAAVRGIDDEGGTSQLHGTSSFCPRVCAVSLATIFFIVGFFSEPVGPNNGFKNLYQSAMRR
jgi:hypothetical protein